MNTKSNTKSAPIPGSSLFYGWVITAVAGLGVFFSGPGQTYSISIFIESYMKEFNWSSSTVSGFYSAATLLAGLLLFITGRLVDRLGHRTMTVIIGVLLAFACFWNSFILNPIMLFFGFFMLRLFGQGSMTLIPNTLVPQWFISKRGRALSFMAIGGFLSSALFPPMNAWLITTFGWRSAWQVWGILLLIIFVPIAYLLIRNRPEDIGDVPDGSNKSRQIIRETQERKEVDWTLKEAMRTKAFWLILYCITIPALVNTGITFHLVGILGEAEIPKTIAATILSIMAIVGFPITFISGYLSDKFRVNRLLALTFIGHIVAIFVLINLSSVWLAIGYGIIWGMVSGFERITLNIVWPNYFGRKHLGSIKGIAMMAMVIGSAFGPLPFGIAFDYFGGYKEILIIMMAFPLLGAISALLAGQPRKLN